jgi:mycoredoxin
MPDSNIITIYATEWCGDCRRARKYFDKYGVAYRWIDIDDDEQAEQLVIRTNKGMRSVPTIFFPDGDILVEPSNAQLERKLNHNKIVADQSLD